MNNLNENSLSRAIALREFMLKNNLKWSSNLPITNLMGELDVSIKQVQQLDAETLKINKGITEKKGRLRGVMMEQAMRVQGAVLAYAASVNNEVLLQSINFSKTKFIQARDTVVYDLCRLVMDEAIVLKTELGAFGLVQKDFDDFENGLKDYADVMQTPRSATSENKIKHASLKAEVRKINGFIKGKLNYYMLPYRTSDPDFYNNYKEITQVIDLGKRKVKGTIVVKGKTIAFESGEKLVNVKVRVDDEENISSVSNVDGEYELLLKKAGTYVLIAEKTGCYQSEEELEVEEGNSYEVNFEMEPKVVAEE